MGSIVPLQDLNFFPDPTSTTTATSAATTVIKIPKLEPKLEPWDEHHISSPIPNFAESNPISSEENNVYSEFYRVSELFRTAFAILFPHLMLFAMENIPPLRELSLDYGVADEWTGKLRICS
ncbi:Histone-lysine N-methyltransferase family member protein [Actinidia chinensis var. chinensis]|uniref:Histone-lysine N-methyltransferase family member protein n=1 Tax=Actinidia chinensis var. chinensis TaxID=1590841 RepID=A0A2R6S073_ACTCC|nr:Histone-lysine N-methyltransferase family member protein [Actinidia chinensis var. chinensis]